MRKGKPTLNVDTNVPATSEVPTAEALPLRRAIVPHPDAEAGGLDNIPEETLSPGQQREDELDHAGLDEVLPGEDQARVTADEEAKEHPEKWAPPI